MVGFFVLSDFINSRIFVCNYMYENQEKMRKSTSERYGYEVIDKNYRYFDYRYEAVLYR